MRILSITTGSKTSQTHEDILLLAGCRECGTELTDQEMHMILTLPATVAASPAAYPAPALTPILERLKNASLANIEQRNMELFQQETDKLDHWAEDQRRAQKGKLDDIDLQSKALRKQVRDASSLPEKLNLQQELRALERHRIDAWKSFDEKSRSIEEERDRIESEAARLLAHSISEEPLFHITWQLK